MKKARIVSLALAMFLLVSQTAQAEIFITPFGEKVEISTETRQEETRQESGNLTENGAGAMSGGPGAYSDETVQAAKPSASYRTTEAVPVEKTADAAVPEIASEGAVLYDATHDVFLYEKNADTKYYPASITKLLTALLVLEHADLNDMVTFSKNAVTNLESGAVTLSLKEGDRVSVEDCLYGLLLKSANEVANGLAEHVGGSISGFASMMNEKAKSLGCTGSNFVNPNGLNNANHYTTAHDMARIAKAAFENETLCKIASTTSYQFPATKAAGARTITMGHKMLYPNDSRYYHGIVGGKTGYTSLAGNTLVTCVEKDGLRLIAVILKSKTTHYTDTKALLDHGYSKNPTACHKWIADGESWRFELADGTRLSDCFVVIDEKEYVFDTEGKMVTGWRMIGNDWHCFGSSGAMVKNAWRKDGEYWFYLGADGAMVKNAWIDQQYYVGADGIWVQA